MLEIVGIKLLFEIFTSLLLFTNRYVDKVTTLTVCTFCLGDNKLKPSLLVTPTLMVTSSHSAATSTSSSSLSISYFNSSSNSSFESSSSPPLSLQRKPPKKLKSNPKKQVKDLNNNDLCLKSSNHSATPSYSTSSKKKKTPSF